MWIKLSKLFFSLLVLYYGWYQIVFSQIPNMLIILGAFMIAFIIVHAFVNKINLFNYITLEWTLWFIFAFTSFVFGIFVARNQSDLIDALSTFIQFLVLIYGIIYISGQDQSIDFFVKLFVFFALICAITTVLNGVEYSSGRISMGLRNNPNSLGVTMAIGICLILYKLDFQKLLYSINSFIGIVLMIYVIILTGSRKSFLSIVLIFAYWVLFIAVKEVRTSKMKGILIILSVILFSYYVIYPFLQDSILLFRLTDLINTGDKTRTGMYRVAFDLFKRSPIVGIGFNNYQTLSGYGTYSHSTYAEALACTGLVGSILYFSSYLLLIKKFIKLVLSKEIDKILLKQSKIMFGLFGILLFLGIGIIHFYGMPSSIAFGMIIAFCNINKKECANK